MRAMHQKLLPGVSLAVLEAEMNALPTSPRPRPAPKGKPDPNNRLTPIRSFVGEPCPYCAFPMQISGPHGVTRDHAHRPRSQGGMLCDRNRVIACLTCNGDKKDRSLVEWYAALKRGRDGRATLVLAVIERERVDRSDDAED